MNNETSPVVGTDRGSEEAKRKPWRKPASEFLPIEETRTNASTGNDGNGATTHS